MTDQIMNNKTEEFGWCGPPHASDRLHILFSGCCACFLLAVSPWPSGCQSPPWSTPLCQAVCVTSCLSHLVQQSGYWWQPATLNRFVWLWDGFLSGSASQSVCPHLQLLFIQDWHKRAARRLCPLLSVVHMDMQSPTIAVLFSSTGHLCVNLKWFTLIIWLHMTCFPSIQAWITLSLCLSRTRYCLPLTRALNFLWKAGGWNGHMCLDVWGAAATGQCWFGEREQGGSRKET